VKGDFPSRDVPIFREHLPPNHIVARGHAREFRGNRIGRRLVFNLELVLVTIQADPREPGPFGVDSHVEGKFRGNGVSADYLVRCRNRTDKDSVSLQAQTSKDEHQWEQKCESG
jgi:hypothetical protein